MSIANKLAKEISKRSQAGVPKRVGICPEDYENLRQELWQLAGGLPTSISKSNGRALIALALVSYDIDPFLPRGEFTYDAQVPHGR